MDVFEALHANTATRAFTGQSLDKALINDLVRAATLAPTAMHMEPWAFAVVQDAGTLLDLCKDAKAHTISTADRLPDSHRERLVTRAQDPAFDVFYNAGTLIVVYGNPTGSFYEADCWMAAENLMLAAAAHNLGTCVIGLALGALDTPEWKKTLGVPPQMKAIAPIIVGVPSAEKTTKDRQPPKIFWT